MFLLSRAGKLGKAPADGLIDLADVTIYEVVFQGTHRLCHGRSTNGKAVELLLRLPQEHAVKAGDTLSINAKASDAVILLE